jgi:hypothetical protein
MTDPYRSPGRAPSAVPATVRQRLPEPERPPLRLLIRVRSFSDGSTEMRLSARRSLPALLLVLCVLFLLCVFAISTVHGDFGASWCDWAGAFGLVLPPSLPCVYYVLRSFFGAEWIVLAPSGLARRRRLRRSDVVILDEVSTIVVSGSGDEARVDVQLGRQRLRILEGLAYSEEQLRWCAQRLRRALDHARAARNG